MSLTVASISVSPGFFAVTVDPSILATFLCFILYDIFYLLNAFSTNAVFVIGSPSLSTALASTPTSNVSPGSIMPVLPPLMTFTSLILAPQPYNITLPAN